MKDESKKGQRGKHRHPNSLKNLKSFKPGQSGNPGGMPKGYKSMASRFREQLLNYCESVKPFKEKCKELGLSPKKTKIGDLLAICMMNDAIEGKSQYAIEVLNRVDGKVAEIVRQELFNGIESSLDNLSEEQLENILKDKRK